MTKSMSPASAPHLLTVTWPKPALVELRLTLDSANLSSERGPAVANQDPWDLALEHIVQAAFASRDVCFVAFEPRLAWGDLAFENLSPSIQTIQRDKLAYTLACIERVSRQVLADVASSQDFRHSALLIAAIPPRQHERITQFLDTLAQTNAEFPGWDTWIRLPANEVAALLEQQSTAMLRSNEEFMECVDDGERVHWYHPRPEALAACLQELQAVAVQQGWQIAADER